jgi:hypothetical protein
VPPVIYEARDVVGDGRYLRQIRISTFPTSRDFPQGLRYSLCLVDLGTGEMLLLYDIHRGKPHHRHVRKIEMPYEFVDGSTLLNDFFRDVDLIVEGKL